MMKVLKFESVDCAVCRQVSDLLDRLGIHHERIIPFDRPKMAIAYHIRTVPTVIIVDGDSVLNRTVGFVPDELEAIALLIGVDNRRKAGAAGLLSTGKTYFTSSVLGGIFPLEYLGMDNGKHVFESKAFLNRGHLYRIDDGNLDPFLYNG